MTKVSFKGYAMKWEIFFCSFLQPDYIHLDISIIDQEIIHIFTLKVFFASSDG